MQIGSTIPPQNHFLFRRTNFANRGSPLNPLTRPSASTQTLNPVSYTEPKLTDQENSTESLRTHLSNLEKLLQKNNPNPPPISDPHPVHQDSGDTSPEKRENGILKALNLARLWSMKAVDEMSPRNMSRLQRLLSKSQEYSPRNNLGCRWREYHGSNDWIGLLDPLDENLRREVVRYGEFVQAAYQAFHSNPATLHNETSLHRHVALHDRYYKVTKSLYATASVGLPAWVDDVAPDLGWMTQRSSWIGYVAVCDDQREIARMGRRDIVIALRGTATCLEWAENIRDGLVRVPGVGDGDEDSGHGQPKVACGFLNLYKTRGTNIPSLAESVNEEIRRLMELYKGETLSITITGHSLGAALALLAANDLSACIPNAPPIAVISFGSPRVGNRGFANRVSENGVKVLRVVNSQDMITRVPGFLVNEGLDERLRNMPWAYSHVGTELKVDSKMSPYLKPNADMACCHDLEAYLHLVDGFLASNCPFRENAKRSLVRLLDDQGSNVKKLYTSKAKSLILKVDKGEVSNYPSCLPSPSS